MTEQKEPNCMQGYGVYNRHENCPYALICAICDEEAEIDGRDEP